MREHYTACQGNRRHLPQGAGDALDRLRSRHDAYSLKLFEHKQIRIARHDQIGLRGQRTSEYSIVIRVTAHGLKQGWRNHYLREDAQLIQNPFLRVCSTLKNGRKLLACDDFGQLIQQGLAHHQFDGADAHLNLTGYGVRHATAGRTAAHWYQ